MTSTKLDVPDNLTREGAPRLAVRIVAYWDLRGCSVAADVVPEKTGANVIYVVRSDMKNGAPRFRRPRVAARGRRPVKVSAHG